MPWDGTELLVANLDDRGLIGEQTRVAGGIDEAVIQPEWSPTGQLFFISDCTGWANLYCRNDGEVEAVLEESVLEMEAEFARSNWWVCICSYGSDSPDSRVCTYSRRGYWRLAQLCQAERRLKPTSNPDYVAPEGAKPPLVVMCHGGLHSTASAELNLTTQYWTSRGVAVLDVNYGGSTGFGREYRERLIGEWGVVDVNDRVNAPLYLVGREDVDGQRMAISGGRAGGFTAPAALTFRDVFKAGQVISE